MKGRLWGILTSSSFFFFFSGEFLQVCWGVVMRYQFIYYTYTLETVNCKTFFEKRDKRSPTDVSVELLQRGSTRFRERERETRCVLLAVSCRPKSGAFGWLVGWLLRWIALKHIQVISHQGFFERTLHCDNDVWGIKDPRVPDPRLSHEFNGTVTK